MVKGGRENWCGFFHQVFRGITGKKGRPGLAALPVISGRYLRARHPGSPVRYDPDQDQRRPVTRPSRPQRPPHGDRVCGAEIVAQKTHAAELALLRVHTVPFDRHKDAHRAEVYAPVFCMAMAGPAAEVRIDVHLSPYRCCGSDFHERAPVTRARRETAPGFLSELFGYLL